MRKKHLFGFGNSIILFCSFLILPQFLIVKCRLIDVDHSNRNCANNFPSFGSRVNLSLLGEQQKSRKHSIIYD